MKKFTSTTWRLLNERLQMVLSGAEPPMTRKRTFFYKCRLEFQQEWNLKEIDLTGTNPYASWGTSVNNWASAHIAALGVAEGRFWEVLGKLNIWPHERGISFQDLDGKMDQVLVNHETKEKIVGNCSFIIVSEKETLCRDLWETLSKAGFKGTIISMGGHNTGAVQSLVADVADELQRQQAENFFILSLHDFDLDGVTMVMTLRKWFPWVIDAGINRGFLKFNKINRDRLIWENVINRKKVRALRKFAKRVPEYSKKDIDKLHGDAVADKRWEGKRVEIDSVYAKYGIEPFIEYIKDQLKDVPCWDLTRIGIKDFELEEPTNYYDKATEDLQDEIGRAYGMKVFELSKTLNKVLGIVRTTLTLPETFDEIQNKYRGKEGTYWSVSQGDIYYRYTRSEILGEDLMDLMVKHADDMYREWIPDSGYESDLKEINNQLSCYKGDITTAKEDIEVAVFDIQEQLNNDKENDEVLQNFKDGLEKVEWGEDELKEIEESDPIDEINTVIEALEELKEEYRLDR